MTEPADSPRIAAPGDGAAPPAPADPEAFLDALPAIARVAAGAWWRLTVWSVATSAQVGARVARAAADPEAAAELAAQVSEGLRAYARGFLGIEDLDDRVKRLAPPSTTTPAQRVRTDELLRAQGTELLRQAADVHYEGEAHPAYGRILTEVVPDEGRVLRLLATEGSQPMVDVRASNLIGVGSQLVAQGLNMIGAQAGVRHRDRVGAYLNNLFRLGLVSFAYEPLEDTIAYQVLEAQPDVMKLIKETTRAKTVHRAVSLTPFGADFCRVCLPLGALPHSSSNGNGNGHPAAELPAAEAHAPATVPSGETPAPGLGAR